MLNKPLPATGAYERPDGTHRFALRRGNDAIVSGVHPFRGRFVLRCECARDGCTRALDVHEDEYRLARRRRGCIVACDRVNPESERKVSGSGEVCIVVPRTPRRRTASSTA